MDSLPTDGAEAGRIAFLIRRDGERAAREWVERTRAMYRSAIETPGSHASKGEFRARFQCAIAEFDRWLEAHPAERQEGVRGAGRIGEMD